MVTKGKAFDIALGMAVMGTVGTLIGQTMGGGLLPLAITIGVVLGVVIGFLGGRRFLISILAGTVIGGVLAWLMAGVDRIWVGAELELPWEDFLVSRFQCCSMCVLLGRRRLNRLRHRYRRSV
ncbi:MAG: hypothetical protein HC801_11030 [Nitrospira sp.]|nr:hypothetical protein [Nitrospira sp.]